ncbi:MAG: hypothetical protein M3374_03600 [Pseudomonadota bacterium]|nr:hypothetical protein [Pseudomonadota bacterium]
MRMLWVSIGLLVLIIAAALGVVVGYALSSRDSYSHAIQFEMSYCRGLKRTHILAKSESTTPDFEQTGLSKNLQYSIDTCLWSLNEKLSEKNQGLINPGISGMIAKTISDIERM